MSTLTYGPVGNTVTLPYCNITQFRQEVVYDEANTDWMLTKFDVEASAVLNANYLSILAPQIANATKSPCDIMNSIRSLLLKPRQSFSMTFAGVQLIPGLVGNGTVDARNGPQPKYCQVIQMSNTTWLINYGISACYWENVQGGQIVKNIPGASVITNRWSESVDIDSENFTTKSRDGKFIIRSDNIDSIIADKARIQMAAVSIPAGFMRQSGHYTVSPDGLAIAYRLVDKEVFKKPPSPSFRAEGTYREISTRYGAMLHGECRVKLWGSKDTSQAAMIRTAIAVCGSKINIRAKTLNIVAQAIMTEEAYVEVDMYNNTAEVFMRVLMTASPGRVAGAGRPTLFGGVAGGPGKKVPGSLAAFGGDMVTTPADNSGVENNAYTPPFKPRGSASLLLNAAAYYDPNLRNQQLGATNDSSGDNTPLDVGSNSLQLPGNLIGPNS